MKEQIIFRDNGAIGALLDEYERAIADLNLVIKDLSDQELTIIVDKQTQDLDCVSIQSVLTHVIRAGLNYVVAIRKWLGEEIEYFQVRSILTVNEAHNRLNEMFDYTEKLFFDYPNLKLEEKNPDNKIMVSWGQRYDAEQLLEHAIVHILRHRRQIQRFIPKL